MIAYFEKTELEKYFDIDIIFNFKEINELNKVGYDLKNKNIELNINEDNDDYEIDIVDIENIIKKELI